MKSSKVDTEIRELYQLLNITPTETPRNGLNLGNLGNGLHYDTSLLYGNQNEQSGWSSSITYRN